MCGINLPSAESKTFITAKELHVQWHVFRGQDSDKGVEKLSPTQGAVHIRRANLTTCSYSNATTARPQTAWLVAGGLTKIPIHTTATPTSTWGAFWYAFSDEKKRALIKSRDLYESSLIFLGCHLFNTYREDTSTESGTQLVRCRCVNYV